MLFGSEEKLGEVFTSGMIAGRCLSGREFDLLDTHTVKSIVDNNRFMIVNDIELTPYKLATLCQSFGKIIGTGAAKSTVDHILDGVTDLDGADKRAITGDGPLPFHVDGNADHHLVDYVFLYSYGVSGTNNGGRTRLCDYSLAHSLIHPNTLKILHERDHFVRMRTGPNQMADWRKIHVWPESETETRFYIYLPFESGDDPLWECRVDGLGAEECDAYFRELRCAYRDNRSSYAHEWETRQLLIFDNRRLVHEREPYDGLVYKRRLLRCLIGT